MLQNVFQIILLGEVIYGIQNLIRFLFFGRIIEENFNFI